MCISLCFEIAKELWKVNKVRGKTDSLRKNANKNGILCLFCVIPRHEGSPQEIPQSKITNLCRATNGDPSFLGMTRLH